MQRVLTTTIVMALLMLGSRPADAISERFTTGITLSSISGAGALVAGFGSLVYISDLEYSRGWGWLSLLSGIGLGAGGITLAGPIENEGARKLSSAVIAAGALSFAIGIVGLTLPRMGSPRHAAPPEAAIVPLISTLACDGSPLGGFSFGVGGVF